MTMNERLRALLDECGVEWERGLPTETIVREPIDALYVERPDGRMHVYFRSYLTPEQAIAATMGTGTCHVIATKKLGDSFGYRLSCGHSMVNPFDDHPDYCPWCGAKVVDE